METIFDSARLLALARKHKRAYATNQPFPHIILDDFLPPSAAEKILAAFPSRESLAWDKWDSEHEVKLGFSDVRQMNGCIREALYQLNSAPIIEFLEELTGIGGLIPDPDYWGGGIHQIEPGGFLNIHADFSRHPRMNVDRRLNLLLYLNKDWEEEYNGHLELWDREMSRPVQRVAPIFNRCVIFDTTDFSYHGHPDVLRCPPGTTRKSLALYYYTNGRPPEEVSGDHSTMFRLRPGEDLRTKYPTWKRFRRAVLRFVPPVIIDAITGMKQAR